MIKKRKLREQIVKSKIERLIDSVSFVEENLPKEFEDFKDSRILKNALYKEIEFAIENIIDICNIINSDLRLGVPEVEDDIFDHIENKKIFDKKIIDLIREMKRFRNVLIHKYGEVDDKKAFENIKEGIKDFELIVKEVEEFLEKHKNQEKEKTKQNGKRK